MKCPECGADIYDDAKKCPFCKLPIMEANDGKFKKFDVTYTITSAEQIKLIRDSVNEVSRDTARIGDKSKQPSVKRYTRIKRAADEKKKSFDRKKLFAVLAAVLSVCLAVGVIAGACAVIGAVAKGNREASAYTYMKENSMYMIYNGRTLELTQAVINKDYLRRSEEDNRPETAASVAEQSKIVKNTQNGTVTYFFDDFDPDTGSGSLKVIENGRAKKIHMISQAVHNSPVLSADGEKVLYLQSTDKNGDMGVLYYWKKGMNEPFKIATDIDKGTFMFTADGKQAMFLQNLNRIEMQGDLYIKNLEKLKAEKVKLDTGVCGIFGTNSKSSAYIYGKDFDTADSTFDIYSMNKKGKAIRLGERTKLAPYIQKKKNRLFVYGAADDGTNNLYRVEISSGKKERIASGVNRIYGMTRDEKTVIYDKVYENRVSDCYIYTNGKQPRKIAGNISVDFSAVGREPQFAVSPDLSVVVYISGFDPVKGGGALYTTRVKNGEVSEAVQVAEDVRSCYVGENKKVIFTKDYSTSRKVFDVYSLSNGTVKLLKDEVSPEMFGVSKSGNNIFYIADYNVSGEFGSLERMDIKGKSETISAEAWGFWLTNRDDLLFYRNINTENGEFDLYLTKNGRVSFDEMDKKVSGILLTD